MDLSQQELEKIKADAKKEVEAEIKKRKAAALKEEYKQAAMEEYLAQENETIDGEKKFQFTVDLPKSAADLRTNGKIYRHGHTYMLTKGEIADLQARQYKAWEHHRETRDGEPSYFFGGMRKKKQK